MTRSRPSSPVCGSFAASAGAGPLLRPSRARSESRARPAALMPASSVCHRVTRSFFMPMTNTSFRRGAKLSVPISSSVIAAMVMALAVQGAAAAPARTPDQQLVAGLKTARAASQKALSSISPASPTGRRRPQPSSRVRSKGSMQPAMPRRGRSERSRRRLCARRCGRARGSRGRRDQTSSEDATQPHE